MRRYNPKEIELKWQQIWDKEQTYKADLHSSKPKYYAMSMLNYPSGDGIHIGHAMNYTISDVMARVRRQQGFESYHPVGWDAFGLPAENYAIRSGVSPQVSMAKIIPMYHKQYKAMGWSNDWSKEISTHEPQYYKWTQWIFSEMHRRDMAYQASRMQWWCTIDKTVLADEQVTPEGKCWRHDGPNDPQVEKREVKQWFFKITDYAEELLAAIEDLDWSKSVKLAQKNWIGKSAGALIDFQVDGASEKIPVFTTRPDTIFGATYLAMAPENPLTKKLTSKDQRAKVEDYIKQVSRKTELERQQEGKDKTGVFTGFYAINPATKKPVPVWVADYVLMSYGTGAIMAVPAHDERDFDFAQKYNMPIVEVIEASTFDEENPPREGKENTKRDVVICLIKDKSGRFLTLKWQKLNWQNFVMGGVEKDEDLVEAAKREIAEETGYIDLRFAGRMPFALNSVFYAAHKDVNRDIRVDILQFELATDKRIETKKDVYEDFEPVWVEQAQLKNMHPVGGLEFIVRWVEDGDYVYTGEGRLINSGKYSGMNSAEARGKIVADLARAGVAQEAVNYKMRDWSVSRQRYWGAPIPIIHCTKCGPQLVPDEELPVVLPELKDFESSGDGRSALARATDWLKAPCPNCGGTGERETDTMDTFVDSSWYFIRYLDPHNNQKIFDSKIADHWMPVDFYNGADHATAHLIYARFVERFLSKIGLVKQQEPFKRFLFNGKVTAQNGENFSKSKGNGVDPLEIIAQGYGADALRTYLMFAAPLDLWVRWDPQGVPGTYRFLSRLWNLTMEHLASKPQNGSAEKLARAVNKTVKKVTADIDSQKYNTAIAAMMACVNELYAIKADDGFADHQAWQSALESLVQLAAPFAPFMAEELWHELGHQDSIHIDHWPAWDEDLVKEEAIIIAVQINGKVRAEIEVEAGISETDAIAAAKSALKVVELIAGKKVKKEIYVPGRLVSLVI